MPFYVPDCPKCGERPETGDCGIKVNFEILGDKQDCPECGAKDVIEIEWETEYYECIDDDDEEEEEEEEEDEQVVDWEDGK